MNSNTNHPTSPADLRNEAEQKAAQSPLNPALLSPEQIQQTLHELRVHQIELEMQNEELRQSQTDLCASQARYFDLYDVAPIGYCILSEKGVVLEANLTAANLLGVARGALVKHPLNGFILREDQDNYYRHRRQLFAAYEPDTWELRMVKKDGTAFWAGLDATVVQEKNGEFVGRIVLKDITGRKQAESALLESEIKYRSLVDGAAEIILVAQDNLIKFINRKAVELLGYSEPEFLAKPFVEFIYPDDRSMVTANYMKRIEGEPVPDRYEFRALAADGSALWVEISAALIVWEGKKASLNFLTDITERKKAEDNLQKTNRDLDTLLSNLYSGILSTSKDGEVEHVNQAFCDLFNLSESPAGLRGLSSPEMLKKISGSYADPAKALARTQILVAEGRPVKGEEIAMRDGRFCLVDFIPVLDKDGNRSGRIWHHQDITGRKRTEEALSKVQKLESLGVLAGGIAHDFNNLLGGIFGYLDMARERSADDKTVSQYLDKAATVFERAKDLTQQLLTFSKGGTPKLKTGQLGKLVRENAAFVLSGTNVSCDYRIAQDLWLADYDENQIGQVIDNIVLNAQQAMPVGGKIVISVNNLSLKDNDNLLLKAGNYIKVSITDTGVGIPLDLLKRIFDPFFTTKQKGSGLGLATCFSIVQKHDGGIDVESIPGEGSTFHIYLPATQKGTIQDISQVAMLHKGKGTFLVMDDKVFMREIVGDMLKDMGYTLIQAKNGEEALRLCAEAKKKGNPIGGALFDLTIPGGMGGKEAIVMLRKDFPDMPVFASSGFSDDPTMARPTEFGFTDSIRKPFKKGELAEMLNKHIKTQK